MTPQQEEKHANDTGDRLWQETKKLQNQLDDLEDRLGKSGLKREKGLSATNAAHITSQTIQDATIVAQNGRNGIVLDVNQFREYVIRPTLLDLGMWSEAAEDLMLGTAVTESHLTYLVQHDDGPAKGVYQIEWNTASDILNRYLRIIAKDDTVYRFAETTGYDMRLGTLDKRTVNSELITNLKFATAVARLRYYMVPEPLPEVGDLEGYARYWKKYYNTHLGAGTEEKFTEMYREFVK